MRSHVRLIHFRATAISVTRASTIAAAFFLPGITTLDARAANDSFDERIAGIASELAASTALKALPPERQRDATFFVVGNMLFSVAHEFGHMVMSEMQMPVLGRQEDAADSFAIVAGLKMMTDTSERALIEAGKGWFFTELDDRKRGTIATYYNSHGMNLQRAYQIVCYMVGANPEKFKALADTTKIPEARQKTCKDDYAIAAWSWEELLKPYRRTPGKPTSRIDVTYNDGQGSLAIYEKTFRELRFLDRVVDVATDKFVWRRPLSVTMETCGKANAWWSEPNARITVCYELVDEFVKLYLQFMGTSPIGMLMQTPTPTSRQQSAVDRRKPEGAHADRPQRR